MSTSLVHRPTVRFHRNGVAGEGFHTVYFDDHRQHHRAAHLIATVFDGRGQVAVINPVRPLERYRGDDFEPELRAVIEAAAQLDSTYEREAG